MRMMSPDPVGAGECAGRAGTPQRRSPPDRRSRSEVARARRVACCTRVCVLYNPRDLRGSKPRVASVERSDN